MSSLKSKHIWILVILVMAVIIPVRGQDVPGSNIVSRTLYVLSGGRWNYHPYSEGMGMIYESKDSNMQEVIVTGRKHSKKDENE